LAANARAQTPDAPQCPSDDEDSMRMSVNYIEVSPHGADRDCRNCEFWVPANAGAACGECTLVAGPISPLAYCDSWAPAPA
jgi:High potential iron-sulfur protein